MKRVLAATIGVAFLLVSNVPTLAQSAKKAGAEKRAPSAAVAAMRERQKRCGAEWKEAKAAGRIAKGQKWPQYWSACNKRLKSGT